MEYETEYDKLSKASDTWKPELGVYQVVIMGEPEETEFRKEATADKPLEVTPQIKLLITVNQEIKSWYVGKGKTPVSTYGQLLALGCDRGKLSGEVITVLVQSGGDGKKKYTIPQAVEAQQKLSAKTEVKQ